MHFISFGLISIHFYVEYEIHFDSQTAFDNKVEGFKLLPKKKRIEKNQLQIFSKKLILKLKTLVCFCYDT